MSASHLIFSNICCNKQGTCTNALPVILSQSKQQSHIYVATERATARQFLRSRPNTSTCLLVSSRNSAGLKELLKNAPLINTFDSDSQLGTAMNKTRKPSKILAFMVPPDSREVATCRALDDDPASGKSLATIYDGQAHGRKLSCLFDSGASSSFISSRLVKKMGLPVRNSRYKSVATASDQDVPVAGAVTFKIMLGRAAFEITAHVLSEFLESVDVIIGEDFMKTHSCGITYNPDSLRLLSPNGDEVVLDKRVYRGTAGASARTVKTTASMPNNPALQNSMEDERPLPDEIPADLAVRYLNSGRYKSFVAVLTPHELSPDDSEVDLDRVPNQPSGEPVENQPYKLDVNMNHVPPAMQTDLRNLIDSFADIFSETPQAGGANIPPLEHTIDLVPGAKPPFRRNCRLSPSEMIELKSQVTELLAKGIITPINSPYGAPVLFVKKPSGGFRFCLDYRALNEITVKLRYPLPRIDDLLDAARGATCYSSLDMAGGFHQLLISEEDVPKTAFATPFGHYAWRCLPMGLSNAPSQYQSTVNKIFQSLSFVLIYIDDILILSQSPAEHLDHLNQVFTKIREAGLQVRFSKCRFLQEQVKYLGHILSKEGVRADPEKLRTLTEWAFPSNATGILQFLGLANYFRKFVPNLSRLAAPLHQLTKKKVQFTKGEDAILAFEAIKEALASPPVLAYPNPDLPYELVSDASMTGCGAVLTQQGRPVAYFSSKFSPAEHNYTTGEQELLGIIKALKEWRCYLEGSQGLSIVTDHNPLTFFTKQPTLSRRQARWSEFMSRFQFSVRYRPGATNPADSLSRLPHQSAAAALMLFAITVNESSPDLMQQIKAESMTDLNFKDPTVTKQWSLQHGYWSFRGRIIVPATVRARVLKEHHATLIAGHFSWTKTLDLIQRQFWWPSMAADVQQFVSTCQTCQANKASCKRPYGLLQPLPIPDTRWHTVTMDFVFDLPMSSEKNDGIMVIVDKLTKYVCLAPVQKSSTSEDIARAFIKHVYQHHGLPKNIISDRDVRFTSQFWRNMCTRMRIEPRFSTAFHPQTDGQTERMNRVVEEVLRHFIDGNHVTWEELLPIVALTINNAKSSVTGQSPFYLNTARHPNTPLSVQMPDKQIPALDAVFADLDITLVRVQQLLRSAQDRQKTYADSRFRAPHSFKTGDQVMVSTRNFKFKTGVKKLHPKYIGPVQILSMTPGGNAAKLALPANYSRIHPVFHVSLLKPFKASSASMPVPAGPEVEDGFPFYQVETLLSHRIRKVGKRKIKQVLVKWKAYDDTHNSWEPLANLTPDLLRQAETFFK